MRQYSQSSLLTSFAVDIPGLLEACRGYDTPSGNPHPGRGSTDPGLRKQIFQPMVRDHDGHYALDGRFITGNEQVRPVTSAIVLSLPPPVTQTLSGEM